MLVVLSGIFRISNYQICCGLNTPKLMFINTHCMVQQQFTWHSYCLVHESATINQLVTDICTASYSDQLDTVTRCTTPDVHWYVYWSPFLAVSEILIECHYIMSTIWPIYCFCSVLIALNFGTEKSVDDYSASVKDVPGSAQVYYTNSEHPALSEGSDANLRSVELLPGEGAIFLWPYQR